MNEPEVTIIEAKPAAVVVVKPWWASKTLWVNVVAMAAEFLEAGSIGYLSADDRLYILGVINILLRFLTKSPVGRG